MPLSKLWVYFLAILLGGEAKRAEKADFNGAIDVDGHTELDDVNVSGASTFTGAAD